MAERKVEEDVMSQQLHIVPASLDLFTPLDLPGLRLRNRIVMAPMTRQRASADGTPTPLMATYFAQRASAGLIITDCTMVGPLAHAYENCPGIYSASHVAGWREVTRAVHERGGLIFCQLWHCGRRSHPELLNGGTPVAPSPIPDTEEMRTARGKRLPPLPRELSMSDVLGIVDQFAAAARNAKEAGFDDVELHGANGYLFDQFLRSASNRRTDTFSGPIPNRARFLLDCVDAVVGIWRADRVGVKLSPANGAHGMEDDDPQALFEYVVSALNGRGLAYPHVSEPVAADVRKDLTSAHFRPLFKGRLMADTNYNRETATTAVRDGAADLVSFARMFIANPDLPERMSQDAPLNEGNPATFYGGDAQGYTDYLSMR